jgi:hypothetical protein
MRGKVRAFLLPTLLLLLVSANALSDSAQSPPAAIQNLVTWETLANPAAKRSNRRVKINNFEIPLRLLSSDIAERTPQAMKDALIFEKDGEPYIRWLINPEDTRHYREVQKFLKKNGISAQTYQYFEAYQTASRSYILSDPNNGNRFYYTAKVSTDNTGGRWTDKQLKVSQAQQARRVNDYVNYVQKAATFKNVVILDEPMMFGIDELDQAMMIRDLGSLSDGKKYYLPGFSVFDEKIGAKIAKLNGAKDVAAFWDKHANQALGRALGEFSARTGMIHDAPHSQNWLVELDENMKPTGRIVLRDFGDESIAFEPLLKELGMTELLKKWNPDFVMNQFQAGFAAFHGTPSPTWFDDHVLKVGTELSQGVKPAENQVWHRTSRGVRSWVKSYFDAFNDEFAKTAGLDLQRTPSIREIKTGDSADMMFSESADAYHFEQRDNWVSAWASHLKNGKRVRCFLNTIEALH